MRLFTKMSCALALSVLGVMGANAQEPAQVHATFESPANTNTGWTADASGETKGTFTWSTTYYNQLRNIGLPTGDISKYKKLVVDCTIDAEKNAGDSFRVLFYLGNANKTLWAHNGHNEWLIVDELKIQAPDDYQEYVLQLTEICLSGSNGFAPGEVVINDMYLEEYPDGEYADLPGIVTEPKPEKPEGYVADLTVDMYTGGNCAYDLESKIAKGVVFYGVTENDNAYADLAGYTELAVVGTPGMSIAFGVNGEEIGAVIGDDGMCTLDLTQFGDEVKLNYIWVPWSYEGRGTIWYLLLSDVVRPQCATPTISVVGGKVKFACETEGAQFVTDCKVNFAGSNNPAEIDLNSAVTVTVDVYATAEGYKASEHATKTFPLSEASVRGDINGDGEPNISDVTTLVNIILKKE